MRICLIRATDVIRNQGALSKSFVKIYFQILSCQKRKEPVVMLKKIKIKSFRKLRCSSRQDQVHVALKAVLICGVYPSLNFQHGSSYFSVSRNMGKAARSALINRRMQVLGFVCLIRAEGAVRVLSLASCPPVTIWYGTRWNADNNFIFFAI